MTPRNTFAGMVATAAGLVVVATTGGVALTILGVALIVVGAGVMAAAGLLGVRAGDPARAHEAQRAKDAADNAAEKRASETGRWPRVIGGG